MKQRFFKILPVLFCFGFISLHIQVAAQGTWTPVFTPAPDTNCGGMLLLSDGRVIVKTKSGGTDGYGSMWDVLTPDAYGNYLSGTWSTIAPMHDTRLYYSSQVLKDGRVYVAGGEYGTGLASSEIYNPLTNIWTLSPVSGDTFYDANSNMLPNGKVLQSLIMGNYLENAIFDPGTGTYTPTANCFGYPDEAAWIQLPDYSILFNDWYTNNSERYIPATGKWIRDAVLPDSLWGYSETGGALLLPNGKVIFFGGTGHTALYKPSGNTSNGTWAKGPDFPNGDGTADAPAAVMVNGKVLCVAGPKPTSVSNVFLAPITFYQYDYVTDSFSYVPPPFGLDTNTVAFVFTMLDLPNGSVMLSEQGSTQYFIYTPSGPPLAAGKPSIDSITEVSCGTYLITGEQFNGLNQGVTYNDDFQSATNYPLVRLSSNGLEYYARTYNWNSIGVMTDSLQDSTYFTLPAGLPAGNYWLVVTTNGISSDSVPFTPCVTGIPQVQNNNCVSVHPNPSNGKFTVDLNGAEPSNMEIFNVLGERIFNSGLNNGSTEIDLSNEPTGVYMYRVVTKHGTLVSGGKLLIE